jgi:hypothetical protein
LNIAVAAHYPAGEPACREADKHCNDNIFGVHFHNPVIPAKAERRI